jgi:hypothetical protein
MGNCRAGLRVFTQAKASGAMQHQPEGCIIAALHNSLVDCQLQFSAHAT